MSRIRRHHTIREILADHPASTQEELVDGLAAAGLQVTQATISRDLAAIGAVRGPEGYLLPDQAGGVAVRTATRASPIAADRLSPVIRQHAIDATRADSIVVLRTAPGHANFVASELDAVRPRNMVGCIAGDDTIFIATPSAKAAGALAESFQRMMEPTR